MAVNQFTDTLDRNLNSAGPTKGVFDKQAHDQITAMLEQVRSAIAQKVGDDASVRIEPWLSTNEGDGQRLVVTDSDGLEFQLFTVLVPFLGYPVTLRVRGDVSHANDLGQLKEELDRLLGHPDVIAVLKHTTE